MAALSNTDRAALHHWLMRDASALRQVFAGLSKADIRAAVDAADSWADTNAASYNLALPLAARTNLTAKQKAMLLEYVIRRRYEVA
jgi:hypothetical protein